jgi:hypothetical protein
MYFSYKSPRDKITLETPLTLFLLKSVRREFERTAILRDRTRTTFSGAPAAISASISRVTLTEDPLSPLTPSRRWRTSPQRGKHSSIARTIWLCGSTRQPGPIITGASGGTARRRMEPMSAEMRRFGQGCGPREARIEHVRSRAPARRSNPSYSWVCRFAASDIGQTNELYRCSGSS